MADEKLILTTEVNGAKKASADIDGVSKSVSSAESKINQIGKRMKSVGTNLKNFGANMTTFITLPLALAGAGFVKLASDAEETRNRFDAVFGDMSNEALSFAKTLSDSVGRFQPEIEDGLASFQGFAVGMGFAREEAFDMSTKLQALAIDFASFNNLSDGEAQQRFISAMSGSSEVLDRFGINIKASALDIKLLELGFPKVSKGATEAQKAMARFAVISKTMGEQGAIGDAERTQDSFANTLKRTESSFKDLGVSLGNILLPRVLELTNKINGLLEKFQNLSPGTQELIVNIGLIALVAGPLIFIFGTLVSSIGALVTLFTSLSVIIPLISTAFLPIIAVIAAVVAAVVAFKFAWDNNLFGMRDSLIEFGVRVKEIFDNIVLVAQQLWTVLQPIFNGIRDFFLAHSEEITAIFKSAWDIISGIFNIAFSIIEGIVNSFLLLLQGDFTGAMVVIRDMFANIWESIKQIFSAAISGIINLITLGMEAILTFFGTSLEEMLNIFTNTWNAITLFITQIFEVHKALFNSAFIFISNIIKNSLNKIKAAWDITWNSILSALRTITIAMKSVIGAVFNVFESLFNKGLSLMTSVWNSAWNSMGGKVSSVFSNIRSVVTSGINFFVKKINSLINSVNNISGKIGIPAIPNIPALAKGGIVTKPTLAMIGEGGESEAVIPLSKLGNIINEQRETGFTPNVSGTIIPNGKSGGNSYSISISGIFGSDAAEEIEDKVIERLSGSISFAQ